MTFDDLITTADKTDADFKAADDELTAAQVKHSETLAKKKDAGESLGKALAKHAAAKHADVLKIDASGGAKLYRSTGDTTFTVETPDPSADSAEDAPAVTPPA
jgi:hypothetical protein